MTDLMLRPDDTGEIQLCQVADPSIDLTCDAREGGGYRCEVDGPHDNHRISDHTIRHAREGNGYACSAFDEDRTTVIRPITPPAPPAFDPDGVTARLKPPTVLVPIVPRRPPLNPNQPAGLVEAPAFMPTGAELAVHARSGCRTVVPNDFLPSPAAPPRPLPTPPPAPKPADDQGAGDAVAWMWVDGSLRWAARPTPGYVGQHRRPLLLARLGWKRGTR